MSMLRAATRTRTPAITTTTAKMATLARGRAALLEKRADDVVVAFAARTAMGRAKKGQLKDVPVDELLHALFKVRGTSSLYPLAD